MSATVSDRHLTITDDEALVDLDRALHHVLDRVSDLVWRDDDPPSSEAVDRALSFLGKARAIVRVFEEGPQATFKDHLLMVGADEEDAGWLVGARGWQEELETHAAWLATMSRSETVAS